MADDVALVEGLDDLKRAVAELGDAVTTKVAVAANQEAAKELEALLVKAAPYDPDNKVKYWRRADLSVGSGSYGHLRDNLTARKVKARKPGYVVHRVSTGDAFWAIFREYGTVNEPARPWFRPTVIVNKSRIQAIQVEGLRAGIEREGERIGRKQRKGG